MFTGIVTHTGTLAAIESADVDRRLRFIVPPPMIEDAAPGDSMCVSGVCLTMLALGKNGFSADVSAETLNKTTLGALKEGQDVNLELALRASDRLGGHLVSGHVDGCGVLLSRTPDGQSQRLEFEVPDNLQQYIAEKGSVCIDGVSLTVNDVEENRFGVCVIPHTLQATTLGALSKGAQVNLEVDMIARYVERLLVARNGGICDE